MSHVAKIEMEIKDLAALEDAAKRLGMELVRNQRTYKWYGYSVGDYPLPEGFTKEDLGKCEHALRIPGNNRAYEVGVVARRDGRPGYTLLWDFWSGGYGLVDKVGKDGNKLKSEYTAAVAVKHYTSKGYRVQRSYKEDGTIVVRANN
jgi:hypothetical protein